MAWTARAEGTQAKSIGILPGLERSRRGARLPYARLPPSASGTNRFTFHKAPVASAIAYFADLSSDTAWTFAHQPKRDDDRIKVVIRTIENWNAVEYGNRFVELRGRHSWFGGSAEKA